MEENGNRVRRAARTIANLIFSSPWARSRTSWTPGAMVNRKKGPRPSSTPSTKIASRPPVSMSRRPWPGVITAPVGSGKSSPELGAPADAPSPSITSSAEAIAAVSVVGTATLAARASGREAVGAVSDASRVGDLLRDRGGGSLAGNSGLGRVACSDLWHVAIEIPSHGRANETERADEQPVSNRAIPSCAQELLVVAGLLGRRRLDRRDRLQHAGRRKLGGLDAILGKLAGTTASGGNDGIAAGGGSLATVAASARVLRSRALTIVEIPSVDTGGGPGNGVRSEISRMTAASSDDGV